MYKSGLDKGEVFSKVLVIHPANQNGQPWVGSDNDPSSLVSPPDLPTDSIQSAMFPLSCAHARTSRETSAHKKTWSTHKYSFIKRFHRFHGTDFWWIFVTWRNEYSVEVLCSFSQPYLSHDGITSCSTVVGMGCFWGAERKFWQQKGVYSTQVSSLWIVLWRHSPQTTDTKRSSYERKLSTSCTFHMGTVHFSNTPDNVV